MKTTLFVGAGGIEQGWLPVRAAVERTVARYRGGDLNAVFASIVYQLRWLTVQLAKQDGDLRQRMQQKFDTLYSKYRDLKVAIAEELIRATEAGLIRVRPTFEAVLRRLCPGADLAIVTTNWDLCLARAVGDRFPPVYLHGNVLDPESLYLPTEGIEEAYREPLERTVALGRVAGQTMRRLEETGRLVLYGLSLSPLDAELCIVLAEGFHGTENPKEVIVVDLDPQTVVARLRYFVDVEPYCFTPEQVAG